MTNNLEQLTAFLNNWSEDRYGIRNGFITLKQTMESEPGVSLEFAPRDGLTYSLRGIHVDQEDRPLFAMVDVIEGDPRWLSVCFYADLIDDPEEIGDFVPAGLLGEDAICFDVEEYSERVINYLQARLIEAASRVRK